jgi:hypothetical protein
MQMAFTLLISEATWLAFATFSGLRIFSYVPQILRIASDRNGASAISYPTWVLWTCANAFTAAYAATNLCDLWLAAVSSVFALCCLIVIALTAIKRGLHRRAATSIRMTPVLESQVAPCRP